MDWLKKMQILDEAETQAKQQAATKTELDLWRWFTQEADRIYRRSAKAADSWERHKVHRQAAGNLCRAGDISAARAELEKSLSVLQGATITQPDLLTA